MMVLVRLTDFFHVKYQTPLKYNFFHLTEFRVFIVLELIMTLKFS